MGLGDWLMATSQVKRMHAENGRTVRVVALGGRTMWSEVFENNPKILRGDQAGCQLLLNAPNARPYIAGKTDERWSWKQWDIAPGELFLTDEEMRFAEPFRGCVMIEPNTKVMRGNKSWPWSRWQELVDLGGHRFVQCGLLGGRYLEGVESAVTSFRYAAAVLSVSRAFVGTEGALHHAAAALGVPAVVLWSEFISPEFTGYESQRNLRHAGEACGARMPCAGCRESMNAITVDEVSAALEEVAA